jgi:predicted nucleotidyltransferase
MMSLRGRARGGCTMQFGLPDDVLPRLTELLSSNVKVKTITLYGSRAKGNYRLGSDIDLCLDADGLSLPEQFVLENRVDDLLLPWKVDIAVLQKITNPAL